MMTIERKLRLFVFVPLIAIALIVVSISGCKSAPGAVGNVAQGEPKPTTVASIEAKQVAAEQEAAYVVEIEFEKKSAKLGADAQLKIETLMKNVAQPQRLKSAKIISWADREYPSKDEKRLGYDQTNLAKLRGEAVQDFLKQRNAKLDFELYNMARRPGTFGEFMGSADARIKDSLERAGISTTEEKSTSRARKTIVMLLLDEKAS